jgi:protein ImuB
VQALALVAEDLPPFQPELRDLFDPGTRGGLDFDALVERLRARLGDEAVRPLALQAEHRPERAWRVAERSDARPPCLPPRPAWLLPTPVPLRQRVQRLLDAPERIETGWWDGDDVRREYVVAELEGGQRAWLFRQVGSGELVDVAQERHWMLHGWFA